MNHDRHWIEPLSGIHGPEVESLRRGEVVTLRVSKPWWPFAKLMEFNRADLKKWVAKKAVVQGEDAPW
ncbi:MAG: hypothetical protein JSR30_05275 [Proteobacteria bacterium]|nr:hypothetical protein [Pseudomonadota bacterium]